MTTERRIARLSADQTQVLVRVENGKASEWDVGALHAWKAQCQDPAERQRVAAALARHARSS